MKIAGNGIQKYNYILIGYGRNGKEGFDNWKGFEKIPDDIGGDNH